MALPELTGDSTLVKELWPVLVKLLDRFHADRTRESPAEEANRPRPTRPPPLP